MSFKDAWESDAKEKKAKQKKRVSSGLWSFPFILKIVAWRRRRRTAGNRKRNKLSIKMEEKGESSTAIDKENSNGKEGRMILPVN